MRTPKLSYVFSKDDVGGKINFEKFLKDRDMYKYKDQFFECLVNPVKSNITDS